jgi:nicotinamidase-related amidase
MTDPDRWAEQSSTALIVVDLQRGFDDPAFGHRNNPAAEGNVARLIEVWRERRQPIVFVQHDSRGEASPLNPAHPGHELKPEVTGSPDLLVHKSVHSAFHGQPDLDGWLRSRGVKGIVVTGVQTNYCCETTARVGSDLGYDTTFVLDATYTFDLEAPDGQTVAADDLARVTATNLDPEFGRVVTTLQLEREMRKGDRSD